MTYRVHLPWERPPLLQNRSSRSGNPYAKAAAVRVAKDAARYAIRAASMPRLAGANVHLHFRPKDKRRRDADGTCATLKVVLDALVAEGVLPDDSWVEVPSSGHVIHPPIPGQPSALWVEIEPLGFRPTTTDSDPAAPDPAPAAGTEATTKGTP